MHKIYETSLETLEISQDWQHAKIIPIHKSGSKLELNKYRPVSLTSTCCKSFEHIIFKAIITHLETNNLLFSQQRGFRSGLSTTTRIAEINHDLFDAINKGAQIDEVFLDVSKAFDLVPHHDLITKLAAFRIDSKII